MCLGGVGVGPLTGLHLSSGRGEDRFCLCWISLWPWHESTIQQHVLAEGLSKHESGNKYNEQQRATREQHRDGAVAITHDLG